MVKHTTKMSELMNKNCRDLVNTNSEERQAFITSLRKMIEDSEASGVSPKTLLDLWKDCQQQAIQNLG